MNTQVDNQKAEQKTRSVRSRKKRRSKLDPFTPELLKMEQRKVSLEEIVTWLSQRGLKITGKAVSQFLERKRGELAVELMTRKFNSRAEKLAAIRAWLGKHSQPDLGTMVEILKVLMMDLATEETMDIQVVKMADKLTLTAMRFANEQSKANYRERKLLMEEAKHGEWVKCEESRALEMCLAEAKKHPDVAKIFRQAFRALKALDGPNLRHEDGPFPIPASCVQATSPWDDPVEAR